MTLLRGKCCGAECCSGLPPDRILHDLNALAQGGTLAPFAIGFRDAVSIRDFDPLTRVLRYAKRATSTTDLSVARATGSRARCPGLLIALQLEADYGCQQVVLEARRCPCSITPMGSVNSRRPGRGALR